MGAGMAGLYRTVKLTQSVVDKAAPEAARYVLTDTAIPGFWLTVLPSGRKTYVFRYRVGGGRSATIRAPKIGDAAAVRCEKARAVAEGWHADVIKGGDPGGERQAARAAPTMADLFDRYLTDHARPTKKASSIAEDERLIADYLLPAFGKRKAADVTREAVDKFHKGLAHKPYRANRCLAVLSKAFNLAEVWRMRPDGSNPCRHVRKFPETARKRYLGAAELARLGEALRIAERDGALILPARPGVRDKAERVPVSRWAVAAVRLLILTGARKSEILGLRWAWIDAANFRADLPDSKTGAKTIILPPPALAVLESLPRDAGNPHVIQGAKAGAHLVNLKDPWLAIREAAGLDDVRVHDLRHSFASVGASGGASLPIIGALLGHTQASTTQRYAHLHDDPLRATAAVIGGRIAAAMGDAGEGGTVVPFGRGRDR
jgi:integrase